MYGWYEDHQVRDGPLASHLFRALQPRMVFTFLNVWNKKEYVTETSHSLQNLKYICILWPFREKGCIPLQKVKGS
jgi:hypothetical protein